MPLLRVPANAGVDAYTGCGDIRLLRGYHTWHIRGERAARREFGHRAPWTVRVVRRDGENVVSTAWPANEEAVFYMHERRQWVLVTDAKCLKSASGFDLLTVQVQGHLVRSNDSQRIDSLKVVFVLTRPL